MFRNASRGALLGAAAGLILALGDFGASWLWLTEGLDRGELLIRLIALEVPLGATLLALIALYGHVAGARVDGLAKRVGRGVRDEVWERRLWPMPFVLLASPFLAAIAYLLFSGASASKLSARWLLVIAAFFILALGIYLAVRAGRAIVRYAEKSSRIVSIQIAAAVFALQIGIVKVDQLVLPGLYDYLHASLVAAAWLLAALAILILAVRSPLARRIDARVPALGLGTAAVLLAVLFIDVWTLDLNQTVRVALLSPRASGSRSLMFALGPAVALSESRAAADAADRARRARQARRRGGRVEGPRFEGAHVFLVTIDALRADHLGAYGYRERPVSPFIDELASRSVVFETAYAQAPHSSYSLSSLMTSEYLYQRADLGVGLPADTIPILMREAGYYTVGLYTEGIFHTDGARMQRYQENDFGFGRTSHRDVNADQMTDQVLDEVARIAEAGEPPTFLWAHYFDVHEPYEDTRYGTSDIERYDGEIRRVDTALRRMLREADERLERPIVLLITADHGEEFHDHGGVYHGSTVYQEQVRVPLIVNAPGLAPRRVTTPVEIVDLAPTILGFIDAAVPAQMRGDDLRPLMIGREVDYGPVFASAAHKHMVVQWPYKLIADLRYQTFELFDLERDPRERQNLADERRDLTESLRGEVTAWLDSLGEADLDPARAALALGRLGDRRAVEGLSRLVLDESAETSLRVEAAEILSKLPHPQSIASLARAAESRDGDVAAEAVISLGWLGEESAQERLRALLDSDDESRRARAAIGLARLRDRRAVPVLIDAMQSSDLSLDIRYEAIRLAGVHGGTNAAGVLIDLMEDERLRRRAAVAIGRTRDPRGFDPLTEHLMTARHSTVRESSARGLGFLGDMRAIPHLVRAAQREEIPSASESLVRLHAIGRSVGGVDFSPSLENEALANCREIPTTDFDWGFLNRTTCENSAPRVDAIPVRSPSALTRAPVLVILRAQRVDAGYPVQVRLHVGDRALDAKPFDSAWAEQRWTLPAGTAIDRVSIEVLDPAARLAFDHLLVLPAP